ncbi:MAG: hypothetical protein V2I63_11820 [Pseudomonadales bacterium]|nr:hypothetical protein [Pseudomonadales bacterium]
MPRFSLTLLELEGALLVIDDRQLDADLDRRDALLPYGDLLRAAHLLRGHCSAGRVQAQRFAWPQIEGGDLDQTLPRAAEALAAFAARWGSSEGFIIRVVAADQDASVRSVYAALDGVSRPSIELDGAGLSEGEPAARLQVWRALDGLTGTAP